MINNLVSYFNADGTPTTRGLELIQNLERRLTEAEAKLAAISQITGPTGGVMVDAQARAAIDSIIAGAA